MDLMASFLEIKSINPKLKQSELAKELAFSASSIKVKRECKCERYCPKLRKC